MRWATRYVRTRLPGARSGDDEERPFGREDRLSLGLVEVGEVALGGRDAHRPMLAVAAGAPSALRVYDRHVITAIHTLIYSDDAEATSVLPRRPRLPHTWNTRVGTGLAHLQDRPQRARSPPTRRIRGARRTPIRRTTSISLMCDDIETTKAELEVRAPSSPAIEDMGFGRGAMLKRAGRGRHPRLRAAAPDRARLLGREPSLR